MESLGQTVASPGLSLSRSNRLSVISKPNSKKTKKKKLKKKKLINASFGKDFSSVTVTPNCGALQSSTT